MTLGTLGPSPNSPFDLSTLLHLNVLTKTTIKNKQKKEYKNTTVYKIRFDDKIFFSCLLHLFITPLLHLFMFGTTAFSWFCYIDSLTLTTLNLKLHNAFCLASTNSGTNLMDIQTKMPLTFGDNNFCCGCDDYFFQSFP